MAQRSRTQTPIVTSPDCFDYLIGIQRTRGTIKRRLDAPKVAVLLYNWLTHVLAVPGVYWISICHRISKLAAGAGCYEEYYRAEIGWQAYKASWQLYYLNKVSFYTTQ